MKILSTKDYDQFKTVIGNREVSVTQVNRLVKDISTINMLWMYPGTISKDGYIIDGQHRLAACKANGWEFYYLVSDKTLSELGDTVVALINTAQKRWEIRDFIKYHAAHGKEQYVYLTQLKHTYKMTDTIILTLVSGVSQARAIKRGELKIFSTEEDKQVVVDLLDGYKTVCAVVPFPVAQSRAFVSALRTVFGSMPAEELRDEIIRSNITIEKKINVQEQLRQLEDVVNYRKSEKNHIRFF